MPAQSLPNVMEVTFSAPMPSEDGELVILPIRDAAGNSATLAIRWSEVGTALQVLTRGIEKTGQRRKTLNKSELYAGEKTHPTLVETFQVSDFSQGRMKILSLTSVVGFRSDFALPTDKVDQLGRKFHEALAAELIEDSTQGLEHPH